MAGAIGFSTFVKVVEHAGRTEVQLLNAETGLAVDSARHVAGRLQIFGRHGPMPVAIDLRVAPDSMHGEWQAAGLRGPAHAVRATPAAVRYEDVAEEVWAALRSDFFDPSLNGMDTANVRLTFLEQARRAPDDGSFIRVVQALLSDLGTSHTGFRRVAAAAGATPPPAAGPMPNPVQWRELEGPAGYIAIRHFGVAGAAAEPAKRALDEAFAAFADKTVLVLDLRGNPGGTLDLAAHLGRKLYRTPLVAGAFATQRGLRAHGATNAGELDVRSLPQLPIGDSVTGGSLYTMIQRLGGAAALITDGGNADHPARVVVLVDGRTGSTAEALAAALAERPGTVVAGTRTAGAMLSSTIRIIQGTWELRYPNMDFVTAGGQRVEGRGVEPDMPFTGDDVSAMLRLLR